MRTRFAITAALIWTTVTGAQSVDYHFNGMWYQPRLAGHGFNLVVEPSAAGQTVFVTMFTYDSDGAANFYAGNVEIGEWQLGAELTIPMQQSAGGGFSSPRALDFDDPDQFAVAGELTIRLDNCSAGQVQLQLNERGSGQQVSQQLAIEKLIGVPPARCELALLRGNINRRTAVSALNLDDYGYYLYVPDSYAPEQPVPLLIAWHGAAGPGQAEAQAKSMRALWRAAAEQNGFIVLAQSGSSPNGSWIPSNAATVLAQLLDELKADYSIDPQRIFGWGFSAGGHVMHSIALANPDLFAGYAVNAGALNAVVGRAAPAAAARRLPLSILVGDRDQLLEELRGDRDAFVDAGWIEGQTLHYREFSGGHTVADGHPNEHWRNLRDQRRP